MAEFRLPRLLRGIAIVDKAGIPVRAFQQWWQSVVLLIETAIRLLQDSVAAIQAAQDAADAANAAAAAATTAAGNAQDAADETTAATNLTNSFPSGTPPLLTATDAGANATITVAAHDRIYGDSTTLSITGGSITALAYLTLYYVGYTDPTRADTTPTFTATTVQADAAQTGDFHLIGSVTTPAAAGLPNDGNYVEPPGVGNIP